MDFASKIITDITNTFSLLQILGADFDKKLVDGESIYFSIPEYINVTKEYIDTEVNIDDMKINLCNYQNTDRLMVICKQLFRECVLNIFLFAFVIGDPDLVTTKEDFKLLKECIDEEICKDLKFFSKVRTGETWDNIKAIDNVKQEKLEINNVLNVFKESIGYKKV